MSDNSTASTLADQCAIVTGAGSGIGREIATMFVGQGAKVALLDLDAKTADAAAAAIDPTGERVAAFGVDVAKPDGIEALIDAIEARLGPVDTLVNNAGVREICSCLELDHARWQQVLDVNVTAPFLWSQAVARRLVARGKGGAIINIASIAGLIGVQLRSAYCSSKHGVVGLTKVFALELAEHGIRVNAIAPGGVETPMLAETMRHAGNAEELVKRASPMQRIGKPSEIAGLAAYLASPIAAYVSGTVIPIDGAATAGRST